MPPHTRREALVLLGSAAVAGCLGGDGPGTATSDDRTTGTTPDSTPTDPPPTSYGPTPASEPWGERIGVERGPATASTASLSPTADAWPSAKRDLAATASAPAAAAPDPPLTRTTLAETGQKSMGTPAVGGDVAVFLTGNPDATLGAVDPTSGEERWSRTRDDLGHASPALADGTAFVPWGYFKRDEHVTAVDAATGEDRWEVDVGDSPACDPVVADGTVYAGTDGGAVVTALDAADGERCFRLTLPSPSTAVRRVAVADDRVYAGTLGFASDVPDVGHVLAFDPAAGAVVWTRKTEFPVADLAVADGTVHVGTADRALALDGATGAEQGSRDAPGRVGSVAVDGDGVYLGTDGAVRAFGPDGSERWTADVGGAVGVTVAGDAVFAAGRGGLSVVDAAEGRMRWRDGGPTPSGGPAVAGERAYLGTTDGRLLGYAPDEG